MLACYHPSVQGLDEGHTRRMVVGSHDPRGLVDTTPGGSVNEETASLARELSAGGLAASRTDLNLKKAGLSELPPQIGTRACLTRSHRVPQPWRSRAARTVYCVPHAPEAQGSLPPAHA